MVYELPDPDTQRICVPGYWPVASYETESMNCTAALSFAFYISRRQQSLIFSLYAPSEAQKQPCKSRLQIREAANQRAMQWQKLIDTDGINTRADLARHLGISRARVTQVLNKYLVGPARS